jgi:uncharacterized protein YcbK (DUF882 family)
MRLVLPAPVIHFTSEEICMGRQIPEELFPNILVTVILLDELRKWYNKSIFIHSTYRSPEYNQAIGGKKNSLHLKFNAIDFGVKNYFDLPKLYAKLDEWDRGNFNWPAMGIGLYERQSFIHVDTRGKFGMRRARW